MVRINMPKVFILSGKSQTSQTPRIRSAAFGSFRTFEDYWRVVLHSPTLGGCGATMVLVST
jgi:hypothetical protein